jgi:hypothetical protein
VLHANRGLDPGGSSTWEIRRIPLKSFHGKQNWASGPMPGGSASSADDALRRNLPLLRAVKEGRLEGKDGVEELLAAGVVDVNFQNHCAHCSTLTCLSDDAHATFVTIACEHDRGMRGVAECLASRRGSLIRSHPIPSLDGDTALILSSWYGHTSIARILLEHKARASPSMRRPGIAEWAADWEDSLHGIAHRCAGQPS